MNAVSKLEHSPDTSTQEDGSLVISAAALSRLGNGDMKEGRRELRRVLGAERDHPVFSGPTAKPANVRMATEKDEKAVFDLIMADLKENAIKVAPVSEDRVCAHIFAATRKKGGMMGLIDGPEGMPVALVLLLPSQWWWSNAYYLQEQITFVHPDHRKSQHVDALLQWARWCADEWTKQWGYRIYMLCGVLGTRRLREKIILYRRKFKAVGMAFLYPPPPDMES